MANGKKSFVLYADYIQIFDQLTNDEAGSLVKHLFRYVNDQEPELNDRLLKILFEPIKQQLKRDLKKWEHKREKLSEAGKASAEKRKAEQMSTNVEQPQQSQADPTVTVNATVTVTDTVRESTGTRPEILDSNIYKKPKIPTKQKVLEVFLNHGGSKEMADKFYSTHEATDWFYKGSAMGNFISLVPGYIKSWRQITNNQTKEQSSTAAPLTKV